MHPGRCQQHVLRDPVGPSTAWYSSLLMIDTRRLLDVTRSTDGEECMHGGGQSLFLDGDRKAVRDGWINKEDLGIENCTNGFGEQEGEKL
jgi:hypothetical protein